MTLGSWMLGKIMWERYMFLYYETVLRDRVRHRDFWRNLEKGWFEDAEERD